MWSQQRYAEAMGVLQQQIASGSDFTDTLVRAQLVLPCEFLERKLIDWGYRYNRALDLWQAPEWAQRET